MRLPIRGAASTVFWQIGAIYRKHLTFCVQGTWCQSAVGKQHLSRSRTNMTLEVEARVCGWPHAATMGALGMLHTIVKRDLDINMYGCPLVQARILLSSSLYHSFAPSVFLYIC
jgi:hypothetical protein